jgi:hypothetical protein
VLWGVIAVLFFRWHAQEETTGTGETWDQVERELNRMELQKR